MVSSALLVLLLSLPVGILQAGVSGLHTADALFDIGQLSLCGIQGNLLSLSLLLGAAPPCLRCVRPPLGSLYATVHRSQPGLPVGYGAQLLGDMSLFGP